MTGITITTNTNLGHLSKGTSVCQKFTATDNDLWAISLWVATYCQQINSIAKLRILDADKRQVIRQVEIDTRNFSDNSWQRLSFEPIKSSKLQTFWFCFETDGSEREAITLWTNNKITGICYKNNRLLDEAVCFKLHYAESVAYLLDPLLFKDDHQPKSEIPPAAQETLQKIIYDCISLKDLFYLRLVHLADAFGRAQGVNKVLSIGCGQAYQEAFLASRFPQIQVDATDITLTNLAFPCQNLSFAEHDILSWSDEKEYDFVFSIECLEHIKDYQLAFRNMATKVKPGKYLYISVPFANQQEQQDEALRQRDWEAHQHYLPGFSYQDLEQLFNENGFRVIHAANMFYGDLVNNLNALLTKMDVDTLKAGLEDIGRLFFLDLSDKRAESRQQAVGIHFLGQKIW